MAPVNDPVRTEIYVKHPVTRRAFTFPTNSTALVYAALESALSMGIPGLTFIGAPRVGLSVGLQLAADSVVAAYPAIPVVWTIAGDSAPTGGQFWSSILARTGPSSGIRRDPDVLRGKLRKNLAARALKGGTDRVLLLVDRAHALHAAHLCQIALLQDELGGEQIRLVVALGGYETLLTRRDELVKAGDLDPVTRYFPNPMPFLPLQSAADLRKFLEGFDEEMFPEESSCTYTEFFFPERYAEGWRLAHDAAKAWSAFVAADSESKVVEVEMAYATQAVCCLMDAAFRHGSSWIADEGAWSDAVRMSGIVAARALLRAKQEDDK